MMERIKKESLLLKVSGGTQEAKIILYGELTWCLKCPKCTVKARVNPYREGPTTEEYELKFFNDCAKIRFGNDQRFFCPFCNCRLNLGSIDHDGGNHEIL